MKIPFECHSTSSVDCVQFCDIRNVIVGKTQFHQTQQIISCSVEVIVCGCLNKKHKKYSSCVWIKKILILYKIIIDGLLANFQTLFKSTLSFGHYKNLLTMSSRVETCCVRKVLPYVYLKLVAWKFHQLAPSSSNIVNGKRGSSSTLCYLLFYILYNFVPQSFFSPQDP